MYKIINITEKTVTETVDSILPTLTNVCCCDRCRADIICLTLNRLPPRYVVHRYGEILSEAEFESLQKKTEIIANVMKSIREIQELPHEDKPSRQRTTEAD